MKSSDSSDPRGKRPPAQRRRAGATDEPSPEGAPENSQPVSDTPPRPKAEARRRTRSTRSTSESKVADVGTTEQPAAAPPEAAQPGAVEPAEQRAPRGRRRSEAPRRERSRDADEPIRFEVGPAVPPEEATPFVAEVAEASSREPVPPRYAVRLDEDRIDPDVQKVVRRLVRHGYEAYLVGGCVRDLLLGGKPKDFDVATSARPEQVRELFRNSRVIGRRFRLVHVLFHGGKVIEVATFRRNPNDEVEEVEAPASLPPLRQANEGAQLLIRSDNVFGDAHEDAARRDFTINALFYDVEAGQTLDWVGGLADIDKRVVNTIGEPHLRFREDPVRILRALKFAGRLDLGIQPSVYDAIVECRGALELAARPRVAEEVLRLLRGGGARRTMYLAWETGVLDVLLPELAALLYDSFGSDSTTSAGHRVFRILEFIDRRTQEAGPRDDTILWTLLLLEPLKEATEGAKDRSVAAIEFLDPLMERLAIPRRFADGMRRILAVLPRILSGRAGRFARTELFDLALEVAEADLYARGLSLEPIKALRAAPRVEAPRAPPPAPRGGGHRPLSSHGRSRPTPRH